MTGLGKTIRLARLFRRDGRTVLIAFDHAIAHGMIPGLERPKEAMARLMAGEPDGIVLQKGIASTVFPLYASGPTSLVLKATAFSPYHPTADSPTATVDEAIGLGADAISVGMIVGGEHQREQTRFVAEIVREAERCGLPVGAHAYPRGEFIPETWPPRAEHVAYAVRVAYELGVDFAKTNWTGSSDSFRQVVEACHIPILLAGGKPTEPGPAGTIEMVREALRAGAAGVTLGRAVWQSDDPGAMVRSIMGLVHGTGSRDGTVGIPKDETPGVVPFETND